VQFTLAYVGIRAILIVLYARAGRRNPHARPLTRRYAIGFSIAALIWLASAFVPPPARYAVWALGMVVDFAVPLSSRRLNALLPPDVPHMSERYGLFTIIVMGEAFVKVISSAPEKPLVAAELALGALGLVIVGAMWWIYFDRVAGSPVRPVGRAPYVWIYSHLPLAIGLTAFGVGMKKIVFLEGHAGIPDGYRLLVGSAVAAVLVCVMLVELATTLDAGVAQVRLRTAAHFGCAAAALLLAFLGAGLSPILFMALLAAASVAPVLVGLVEARKHPAHE
jgi:low temperature requirement protein LtrA